MIEIKHYFNLSLVIPLFLLLSCAAGEDYQGLEYAPQMYHSRPYEPLSQIKDKEAGSWLTSIDNNGHGEFYNSNPYNPFSMTSRLPPVNTIRRGSMPNHVPYGDYDLADSLLINPTDSSQVIVTEGKILYETFCDHCHGDKGLGDGSVGKVYKGVTSYKSDLLLGKKGGHIYHVITNGKGRMGAHGSQISEDERWKIVRYVQVLQQQ